MQWISRRILPRISCIGHAHPSPVRYLPCSDCSSWCVYLSFVESREYRSAFPIQRILRFDRRKKRVGARKNQMRMIKHWRAFSSIFRLNAASVLEFHVLS
jgi:hypothetical protein